MRVLIWIVRTLPLVMFAGCGSSGTGGGDDDSDSGDDDSDSDAAIADVGAGMVDSMTTPDGTPSYAPCDSCCDPIAQDCGVGSACHPNSGGSVTTCKTAGTAPLGNICATDTDCVTGTTCLADDFGSFTRCYLLCTVDAECSAFPSTQHTCTLYTVPQGRTPYGLCFP